jgi:uncharacterized protein YbaR (Trm112 family)
MKTRKTRVSKPKLICPACAGQLSFLNSSTFKGHSAITNWLYCFKCNKMFELFKTEVKENG